jgi:hypothetical protein
MFIAACFGLFACVAGIVLYDIFLAHELDRLLKRREKAADPMLESDTPMPIARLRPNLKP